ncbi:MAG: phosphoribosylglycinamide formyltransferase [Kineosporiaceae bacterium]
MSPSSSARPRRVVVLVSGSGTLLQALLDAAAREGHDGEVSTAPSYTVVGVVSDRPDAYGLVRAREAGVATATVQLKDFPGRAVWDEAVARAVEAFSPDLVVLAGFMRLLGSAYLDRFGDRTVNSHPALLPAFPGAHGVRDALAYGAKVSGCSIIFVAAGVDDGPLIAQRAVEVADDDDEASLHERIKVVEREMLVDVVDRLCRDGWHLTGGAGRTVRFGPAPSPAP